MSQTGEGSRSESELVAPDVAFKPTTQRRDAREQPWITSRRYGR